jgi:MYXO-CTERM domain-containing protein
MKNMNPLALLAAGTCAMIAADAANAAVYCSTNFSSGYNNGNLVGQNSWTQISIDSNNPVQVSSGSAILRTSGQDVVRAFADTVAMTASTTLYLRATLQVTAAQSGDYFLGFDNSTTGGNYFGRVFAKTSGSGFVLGVSGQSNTSTYGTSVLNFNETYTVVYAWDFVSGLANDTLTMYVNPNSATREDLTSYVNANWAGNEPTVALASIAMRQGSVSSAPSVSVGSLAAGSSLADVGVVPAPGALALLGVAGLVGSRRRR